MFAIIQNDPGVPPCAIPDVLNETGARWRLVNLAVGDRLPSPENVTGSIILGGEMGTRDDGLYPYLSQVRSYIRLAAEHSRPLLGICLGGQLIAEALGGRVTAGKSGERGMKSLCLTPIGCFDPLFESVPYNFVTFQWHDDSFVLPEDAALLAVGTDCPRQAFRIGASVYGVQFHPEVDEKTAMKWGGGAKNLDMAGDWSRFGKAHAHSGRAIIRNFLKIATVR